MGQAVQERLGQGGVAEDFRPEAELQVRGDADALPFVPIREELEERCSAGTQSQVAQFVDDHQVVPVVAFEELGKPVFVLGEEQFLGQGQGGGEADRTSRGDAARREADGDVGLACARAAQEDQVFPPSDEASVGEGEKLVLREGGEPEEVRNPRGTGRRGVWPISRGF